MSDVVPAKAMANFIDLFMCKEFTLSFYNYVKIAVKIATYQLILIY